MKKSGKRELLDNPVSGIQTDFSKKRRQLFSTLMTLGFLPVLPTLMSCNKNSNAKSNVKHEVLIGAQGSQTDTYSLSWFGDTAKEANVTHSSFRGHGVSQHPLYPASAIMYGRRPATICIEVNLLNNEVDKTFHSGNDRHFFGHGCFNKEGSVLFTTEADMNTGKGKIGIRDSVTYQQIGEYESYGIGPHELLVMPDGKTLVVANGGILTHPKTGREKLNLDTMDSSLTYIDLESGKLLGSFKVSESKASIRHLDVSEDGTVAFAMQFQRSAAEHDGIVPLGGIHAPNKGLQLLEKPENIIHQMNDYMGSVAINPKTRIAGFTSPRGNVAAFWSLNTLEFSGYHSLQDVCGIAVANNQKEFVISNSFGQVRRLDALTLIEKREKRFSQNSLRWDNHLVLAEIFI